MHINMKATFKITVVLVMLLSIVSCNKKSSRSYQYMPNMYESIGYEAYQESDIFKGGIEAQLPADGTIPRGDFMPFEIENNTEGYEFAKANLINPIATAELDENVAGPLYNIYCAICHGSIYHTIYYGKNSMGSYANQLNENERWQVVAYVEKLKADLNK